MTAAAAGGLSLSDSLLLSPERRSLLWPINYAKRNLFRFHFYTLDTLSPTFADTGVIAYCDRFGNEDRFKMPFVTVE